MFSSTNPITGVSVGREIKMSGVSGRLALCESIFDSLFGIISGAFEQNPLEK
jgi:hypothetical protein